MKIEEAVKSLEKQEEMLQFSHFDNVDAWELGSMIVADAKKNEYAIATSIRLNNGFAVFQYGCEGSSLDNQFWMTRKSHSVMRKEMSSLRLYATLKATGETMESCFLNQDEYACCGGGFPIRVKGVGVIGTVMVSGLNHIADHNMLIKCISQYLKVDGVPQIAENAI